MSDEQKVIELLRRYGASQAEIQARDGKIQALNWQIKELQDQLDTSRQWVLTVRRKHKNSLARLRRLKKMLTV